MTRGTLVVLALLISLANLRDAKAQIAGLFGGGVQPIETADLHRRLQQHREAVQAAKASGQPEPQPDFVLVDVRSKEEVDVSIIPGAILKEDFEAHRDEHRQQLIIPYCTVGGRSGLYARKLQSLGFDVLNYKGSILQWINDGLPLVTIDGQPTQRVHTYSNRYKVPPQYEQLPQ